MNKLHISRFLISITLLSALISTTAVAQQPTLSFTCSLSGYYVLPPSVPQDYHGLLIEESYVSEEYTFSTSIFFDAGSELIPDRYILFTDPSQTEGFDDSKIPGGTIQIYYHALNILGYRLRKHPDAKISIVGCNSHERKIDETRALSNRRSRQVYDYLVSIWKIDPARIKMLSPRDLPAHPSDPDDSLGAVENRRVEIVTTDWRLAGTIFLSDSRFYPMPDTMHFQMRNGIADSLVVRREIAIMRDRKQWYVMANIGITDSVSPAYNWGKNGIEDSVSLDAAPYIAQLIVYTRDGQKLRSNEVTIPVKVIRVDGRIVEPPHRYNIDRFALTLFPFDDAHLDRLNQRALQEYVYPTIRSTAEINVMGYTDIMGSDAHNLQLSESRADAVVHDLQKNVKPGIYLSLEGKGMGEIPLYTNDLPEGRFYNRTVQIIIKSPYNPDY